MSEKLFDVVFFGILQAGRDKDTVKQNMATLFKTDASKLAPYFAGGRKVIKGKINAATAEKYQSALENVGLVIKIETCQTDQNTGTEQPSQANNKDTIDTSGISLAPVGADVIENPVETPAHKINDISDLSMAEAGADVVENPVKVATQKISDISHITMAAPGSDVLEQPQQVVAQKIGDISFISLAASGADLIKNPKVKETMEIPDTSELSLNKEKTKG